MFFLQAEDGIRDAHEELEFRRVLVRSLGCEHPLVQQDPASEPAPCGRGGVVDAQRQGAQGGERAGGAVRWRDHRADWPHGRLGEDAPGAAHAAAVDLRLLLRSEEHTSELQSLMRLSYAVFCLKNKMNSP